MNLMVRNQLIISLMQALLGAISPNFRAVLIDFSQGVDIRFFLMEDLAEDREEIDDVITEFDSLAMQVESVSITYGVTVGEVRMDFSGDSVVPVYVRRV